jgi:hypothetical protein
MDDIFTVNPVPMTVDDLSSMIHSFPVCEAITVDDQMIGSISRLGDRMFIVMMILNEQEFSCEFCTEEDFVRLDGNLVAYTDAMRYIAHVEEFHEDLKFKFS